MPQLLGLVLIGAAAVAGYKTIQRVVGHIAGGSERKHAKSEGRDGMKDLGALELDPQSGVYKPRGT